jgi:hypothetical protein
MEITRNLTIGIGQGGSGHRRREGDWTYDF